MRPWTWAVVAAGCAPSAPDLPITVFQRQDDGTYAVVAREVPELADPFHVTGEVGTGFRGGALLADLSGDVGLDYRDGARLRVPWFEADGALVPADEDGLVVWSFYTHLADIRRTLTDRGHDLDPMFPVRFAVQPITAQDFLGTENAAYVFGSRTFVLFPDALEGVPVAANAGVVRHEFGHAWFELLVRGRFGDWSIPSGATNATRALGEGFSDMVASLSLDEPSFLTPSLSMPSRDLERDWMATSDLYPVDPSDPLLYDPYALGTVYASLLWTVREETDDPEGALDLAAAALAEWGAQNDQGASWEDTHRFVANLAALADGPTRDAVCSAAAIHLPFQEIDGCRD